MAYYFLMHSGSLKCSNINDLMKTEVSKLKKDIKTTNKIDENKIVLIANGGICLDTGVVGDYNCGDENNPIFVFVKQAEFVKYNFVSTQEIFDLEDIPKQIDDLMRIKEDNNLDKIQWLRSLEQFSERIAELADNLLINVAEKGIQSHQLLINGWSAAVANLLDSISGIEQRIEKTRIKIQKFQQDTNESGNRLEQDYVEALEALGDIPLWKDMEGTTEGNSLGNWIKASNNVPYVDKSLEGLVKKGVLIYRELTVGNDGEESDIKKIEMFMQKGHVLIDKVRKEQRQQEQRDRDREQGTSISLTVETNINQKMLYIDIYEFCIRLSHMQESLNKGCSAKDDLIAFRDFIRNIVRQCHQVVMNINSQSGSSVTGRTRTYSGRISNSLHVVEDHINAAVAQLSSVNAHISVLREITNQILESNSGIIQNILLRTRWIENMQDKIGHIDNELYLGREKINMVWAAQRVVRDLRSAPTLFVHGVIALRKNRIMHDFWFGQGLSISTKMENIRKEVSKDMNTSELRALKLHIIHSLFSTLWTIPQLPSLGPRLIREANNLEQHNHRDGLATVTSEYLSHLMNALLKSDQYKDLATMIECSILEMDRTLQNVSSSLAEHAILSDDLVSDTNINVNTYPPGPPIFVNKSSEKDSVHSELRLESILSSLPHELMITDDVLDPTQQRNTEELQTNELQEECSSQLFQSIDSTDLHSNNRNSITDKVTCSTQTIATCASNGNALEIYDSSSSAVKETDLPSESETTNIIETVLMSKQKITDMQEGLEKLRGEIRGIKQNIINTSKCFNDELLDARTSVTNMLSDVGHEGEGDTITVDNSVSSTRYSSQLDNVNEKCSQYMPTTSSSAATSTSFVQTTSVLSPAQNTSFDAPFSQKSVTLAVKTFRKGDLVMFRCVAARETPHISSTTKKVVMDCHWVMISMDGKLNLLHTDCWTITDFYMEEEKKYHQLKKFPVGSIVTGIYQNREEYLCKKTPNRFGLPENTKFFLVRAKIDWRLSHNNNTVSPISLPLMLPVLAVPNSQQNSGNDGANVQQQQQQQSHQNKTL